MEDTPLTNALLREYGDMLADSDVSEEQKNTFSMLTSMLAMKESQPQRDDPWVLEWNEAQSKILEELCSLVPGAEVRLYDIKEDRKAGAYLFVDMPLYFVEIDIEDVNTIQEYRKRGVVSVDVHHKPTEEDPERGEIFNSGMVETMEEAGELVTLLGNGDFDDAMRILFRLGTYSNFKVPRTPENLEAVVEKSHRRYTVSRFEA